MVAARVKAARSSRTAVALPNRHANFCLELIDLARQEHVPWDVRRLATLLAERQILKLSPDDLESFDRILVALRLKQPGLERPVSAGVLKEGYTTTDLRGFSVQLQRKLARLNRVHRKLQRQHIDADARREFTAIARRECKLTLARYLFTPEEIVARVLRDVRVSEGVKDVDVTQPKYVDTEVAHVWSGLPEFEARILKCLVAGTKIYWVGPTTTDEINSLIEYPLSTVVLVIKPPGSHYEFELKRAGRKRRPLGVVFTRNGRLVPPSHRLDGGSMQWLLRYEAHNGSKFSFIYRLVHEAEAPLPGYVARNMIFGLPVNGAQAPAFRYFTEPGVFGANGFAEMRAAMKASVDALKNEEGEFLPRVPGDMALTGEFLSHIAPAQAIVSGTSSFRLDKLATYLSARGDDIYFKQWRQVDYTSEEARQFADELLDEVLGVYTPPAFAYEDYESYLEAAFAAPENRRRADEIFVSLVKQIATVWGTLLGVRGHSRGESFVARNVGLRSVWERGEWRVKLIFMDHDALSLPELEQGHFFAQNSLPGILLDERHVWGRANPALFAGTLVGCLQRIYRTSATVEERARAVADAELQAAYRKTQAALLTNATLRGFFSRVFLSRLFDWDQFVVGYLNGRDERWQREMKQLLKQKGYEADTFDSYAKAVEQHKGFFERNGFLFER